MAVIGIDLGTTYSAAAHFIDGETEIIYLEGSQKTLPSVVGIDKRGRQVIGEKAKNNQVHNPQDTIVEVKRKMGEKGVMVALGGKEYRPQQISAIILTRIKETAEDELGEPVTGVVISCPAYFKDEARAATKEAGELAELKVLRIINEPTAAAFYYGQQNVEPGRKRLVMVYDLGGGTFDVTVLEIQGEHIEVIGTGGDPHLGGGNFDDAIVDWMLEELRKEWAEFLDSRDEKQMAALKMRLKYYAEIGKKKLCDSPPSYKFELTNVSTHQGLPVPLIATLTMDKFVELIEDLMQNSLKQLDIAMERPRVEHNYTEDDLTDILLVGGSTRVPYVRELLTRRYPNVPLRGIESGVDPDEVVARGAAIVAAQQDPDSEELTPPPPIDVTGHTLSIAVNDQRLNREILHPLIRKDTPIPVKARHEFASAGQMTPFSKIRVYQGEGIEITADTLMIGEFIIEITPRMEPTPLEIGLELDENGLLEATAVDKLTSRAVKVDINYQDSVKMPKEEMERRRAELAADMQKQMTRSANPLDEPAGGAAAGPAAAAWAGPPPPPPPPAPAGQADPLAVMNPLVHSLVQQALQSFGRLPPERQPVIMQLVGQISQAAQGGDAAAVMTLGMQLHQQLTVGG